MTESPRATVAILSIGAMGVGIAKLLIAHNYRVITNITGRSEATQQRASSASVELLATDEDLVTQADYVLSIVPPRDAIATAQRVSTALLHNDATALTQREKLGKKELWYLDLNAIAPSTVNLIHAEFAPKVASVRFVDGGIIGGPPSLSPAPASNTGQSGNDQQWTRPGIPLSGPHSLTNSPVSGTHLAQTLNTKHVADDIGAASGLKCCFAAMSKGFTALALQSYTSAASLGVLGALQDYLGEYNKGAREKAEKSIVGCTGKAYRWVDEMNQIGQTFAENGGWEDQARVFREIAGVYQALADVVETRGGIGDDAEGVVSVLGKDLRDKNRLVEEELEKDDQ